ncbi:MAG: 1-acyl-sn-glycerol-3-phosphate acyltransferase [Burkholderiaceae bacterium]|jgi:1-acyl-sn-glycerol-3-phosphate acyltransferase|nr:1-acyl-sn-glycerol-3-phosphate acyltransferase [Burkholderiaceae bacterium]
MNLLRSTLHMLWMVITVIPWAIVVVLISPFISTRRLYSICVAWLRVAVGGGKVILGIKNRVTGLDNLPGGAQDAAVLLVKHQSAWETFVMPILMPRQLAYVFKRELFWIPFFGWALGLVDMIHIDRRRRTAAFSKVVQQGRRLIGKGMWVILFPEGTRVARGEKGIYRISGARLAIECGVPVIPVAVTSARCWPPRAFIKRPGIVDISIGRPIPSTGRTADDLMREAEQWIESEMLRLDPTAYPDGQARLSTRTPGG